MSIGRSLLLLLTFVSFSTAAELRSLNEATYTGSVVKVTDREVVFKDDKGEITVPLKEILYLKLGSTQGLAGVKYHDIELKDGTVLHAKDYTVKENQIAITLINGKEIKLSLDTVTAILHEAQDALNRKSWQEKVLKKKRFRDILAIKKNGVVNPLEGTFGAADAKGEKIHFKMGTIEADFPFERAFGLYWIRKPDPDAKPVVCKVLDAHLNMFYASSITTTPTGYAIETPAGLKIEYGATQLANLDYSRGKLLFLSEMTPIEEKTSSVLAWKESFRRDENLDRGPIQLDGKRYERGLSIHSHTELEFDLAGEYREFKTIAGIDDKVGGSSSPVELRILCDGKLMKSWTFSRNDGKGAQAITIPLKDVQRLRIVVTRGKTDNPLLSLIDEGKHLNLAEARVSK